MCIGTAVRRCEKPGVSAFLGVDLVHDGTDLRDGVAMMPLDVAKPLSVVVVVAGMLLVATQLIRMARRHRREA